MDICIVCKKRPAIFPVLSEEQVKQFFCSKKCIFECANKKYNVKIDSCDKHNIWFLSWPKYDLYFICDECLIEDLLDDGDIAGYLPGDIGPT